MLILSPVFAAEAKHGASGAVQLCIPSARQVDLAFFSRFSSSVNKSYAMWLP